MLQGKERWNLFCRMTRRSLLEGLAAPVANVGEDMVISVQTQLKARRTGHVDRPLYFYCFREDSVTNAAGREALNARWESLMENARFLIGLLEDKYGYTGEEPEIIQFKYKCRRMLHPVVHIPEYYLRWKETFPEVDRKILSLRSPNTIFAGKRPSRKWTGRSCPSAPAPSRRSSGSSSSTCGSTTR